VKYDSLYDGLFAHGLFEGKGTFFSAQFSVTDGNFLGGMLHGANKRDVFAPQGVVMKPGTYVNGLCTSEVLMARDKLSTDQTKTWLPDAEYCARCREKLWKGFRHHCRTCGRSICFRASCCKFHDIMGFGTTVTVPLARVCADCNADKL
jgi:hypothetical protein